MAAVTLDLWHTLMFLRPEAEEEYMRSQVEFATEVLRDGPRRPGAPDRSDSELARVFERVYAEAVAEAGRGRTITPAQQLSRAADATGRDARPEEYLGRLAAIVPRLPFERAPGALELLRSLAHDGYGLGVISNTIGEPGQMLRPVLRSMGFDEYVSAYVFSDEHPWTKPAPEIFGEALARLHGVPGRAVHVGDGWSDIEGARRAGLRAGILFTGLQNYGARYKQLFLPDGWDRPATDHVAARLEDVGRIVREVLPPDAPAP